MSEIVKVYFDTETYLTIKNAAAREHISISQHIINAVKHDLRKQKTETESSLNSTKTELTNAYDTTDEKRLRINFTNEDAVLLKNVSQQAGMSMSSYLRRLLYTQHMIVIDLKTDDLREFMDDYSELSSSVNSMIRMIAELGDSVVYKSDIEYIKRTLSEIKELFVKKANNEYDDRMMVRRKMTRKFMKAYRNNNGN